MDQMLELIAIDDDHGAYRFELYQLLWFEGGENIDVIFDRKASLVLTAAELQLNPL